MTNLRVWRRRHSIHSRMSDIRAFGVNSVHLILLKNPLCSDSGTIDCFLYYSSICSSHFPEFTNEPSPVFPARIAVQH
jgi:hypothetical protein